MELTFDPNRWLPPPPTRPDNAQSAVRPEWDALAARLAAAHAFQRHALRAERSAVPALVLAETGRDGGSFHQATARVLAGFAPVPSSVSYGVAGMISDGESVLGNVNPTSSTDRKDTTGKVSAVAGSLPSGNRGLK